MERRESVVPGVEQVPPAAEVVVGAAVAAALLLWWVVEAVAEEGWFPAQEEEEEAGEGAFRALEEAEAVEAEPRREPGERKKGGIGCA